MKFIASSGELLSHLLIISRVINNKNSLPILNDFLFTVKGNTLEMTASDLETTIVTSMNIEQVQGNGSISIRAGLLINTLKEFPEQPLTFDVNLENLSIAIETETGHYDFNGDSAMQFPDTPTPAENNNTLTIPAESLMTCIEKTSFATATEDSRPIVTGIHFDASENGLVAVSTDGHKLSKITYPSVSASSNCSFTLPKKPTALLKTMLVKEEGDVDIQFDDKNIFFNSINYRLICKQIVGTYPNYNSVIPQNNENKVIVKKNEFISVLRRVSVYASQATSLVRLSIKENHMTISARDVDYANSAEENFSCQYEGPEINIGFKSPFLTEMLGYIDTEEVEIALQDNTKAALLFPFNASEDQNFESLMLIMPIMI